MFLVRVTVVKVFTTVMYLAQGLVKMAGLLEAAQAQQVTDLPQCHHLQVGAKVASVAAVITEKSHFM
jgi:hypothetical protein